MFAKGDIAMEIKDIIALIGLIVVVSGWLFIRWKDRKHEIFKERLKKRLDMFDAVIDAILPFLNSDNGVIDLETGELSKRLSSARTKVQLFGYKDEINIYEEFVASLKERNVDSVNRLSGIVAHTIVTKLRHELGY